jgi:type VI secretion system secreted protein Hcp
MAVDMFLTFADSAAIAGESKDKVHKNEIDVLAWSWGMSNSGSAQSGGGAGSGKVNVQDLSVTKWTDKATVNLQLACATGGHLDSATLTVRKAGGKGPVEYIVINMTEVMITSISGGGSGGEDRLTENISLNFAKVDFQYTPQKDDGTADTAINFKFDIAGNAQE